MLSLRRLFVASPILAAAVVILFLANAILSLATPPPDPGMQGKRMRIAQSLRSKGGRHLIVVAPDVFDAVYNGAELDRAPIVWARDLGDDANARLRAYYSDRSVWRLEKSGLRRY